MKITIVADVLGEENNGTTISCMNLCRYLESQGDDVTIVCCDAARKGTDHYAVVGTRNLGPLINMIVRKNNVVIARPDHGIIREAIKDADLVHVMMPFPLGRTAVSIARELDIPTTAGFHCQAENFTVHTGMMNIDIANSYTYRSFYRRTYQYVDCIHYPTQFIRDYFEYCVHHRTPGKVISNGVGACFKKRDIMKPAGMKDRFIITFTGRISREKSHKVLISAVAQSRYKDKIQLIFAGQGPRREEVERYALHLHILKPIINFYKQDELVDVLSYSDLYCHPAEIEIEAIACLEAIACGLVPVIADSRRSATKAFAIDEKNLFKCNDAADLARKIDYWIEHPEEKAARAREYAGFTDHLSQDACMKQMRDMMEGCIREHGTRTAHPAADAAVDDSVNDVVDNSAIDTSKEAANHASGTANSGSAPADESPRCS